jgi:hypothetical protein
MDQSYIDNKSIQLNGLEQAGMTRANKFVLTLIEPCLSVNVIHVSPSNRLHLVIYSLPPLHTRPTPYQYMMDSQVRFNYRQYELLSRKVIRVPDVDIPLRALPQRPPRHCWLPLMRPYGSKTANPTTDVEK